MKKIGTAWTSKLKRPPFDWKDFFATKRWYILTLMIVIPAVLQQILSAAMNLMDNIMVGQIHKGFIPGIDDLNQRIEAVYGQLGIWDIRNWWDQNGLGNFFHLNYSPGQIAVTGVTASNQIFVVVFALMGGFINAVGIFGAQFYGAGRYGSLRQTVRLKIIVGFIIGMIVILLSYTVGYQLISFTTSPSSAYAKYHDLCVQAGMSEGDITQLSGILNYQNAFDASGLQDLVARFGVDKLGLISLRYFEYSSSQLATTQGLEYNQFIVFSYPLLGLNFAFISAFRETKRGYLPLFLTIISVFVNFGFNYLFINGAGALNGFGAKGSALATIVARGIQFILIISVVMWKRYEFQPKVHKLFKIQPSLVKKVLFNAWPIMLNDLFYALGSIMIVRFISQWSFDALSGSAMASTINTMFYTLYAGFGIASSVLIANRLGANDMVTAKYNAKHLLRLGFMMSLGFALIMVACSFFLPQVLFNSTKESLRIAQWMIRIDALMFAAYTLEYTCIYAFKAGGSTLAVLLLDSCFTWAITVVLLFLLVKYSVLDIVYIYLITRFTEVFKMIANLSFYMKGKWAKNLADTDKKIFPEAKPETSPLPSIIDSPTSKDDELINIANF